MLFIFQVALNNGVDNKENGKAGSIFRPQIFPLIRKKAETYCGEVGDLVAGVGRDGKDRDPVHLSQLSQADGGVKSAGSADEYHGGVLRHSVHQVGKEAGGFDPVHPLPPHGEEELLQVLPRGVCDASRRPDVNGGAAVEKPEGLEKLFLLDQIGCGLDVGAQQVDHHIRGAGASLSGRMFPAAGALPLCRPEGVFELRESGVAQLSAESEHGGGGIGDLRGKFLDADIQDFLCVFIDVFQNVQFMSAQTFYYFVVQRQADHKIPPCGKGCRCCQYSKNRKDFQFCGSLPRSYFSFRAGCIQIRIFREGNVRISPAMSLYR